MCKLDEIMQKRQEILALVKKSKAAKIYVFGSVARKEETPESDIDFMIDDADGTSLFDLVTLQQGLEEMFKCKVDVAIKDNVEPLIKQRIIEEAIEI